MNIFFCGTDKQSHVILICFFLLIFILLLGNFTHLGNISGFSPFFGPATKIVETNQIVDKDASARAKGAEPHSRCPKVFMYPLPEKWLPNRMLPRGHADPPLPNPFGERLWAEVPGFHATKHKSAPSIFEFLLRGPYRNLCSTDDPFTADLFFIPWYRDYFCGIRGCDWYTKETPEEQQLFSYIQNFSESSYGLDFFQRRNGYDHFILIPSEAASNLVPKDLKWRLGFYTNVTTFASAYAASYSYPFAALARFEVGMNPLDVPWSYVPDKRSKLVFMAFGTPYGIRSKLVRQCGRMGEQTCVNVEIERKTMYVADNSTQSIFQDLVNGMRESIFCVNIGGDYCTRKAFFDAAVMGCITVAFSPCPLELYQGFIDMSKISILLDEKYAYEGLEGRLREVPEWDIRERQLYLARNAHRLQYSLLRSPEELDTLSTSAKSIVFDDAFFNILRNAYRNVRDARQCDEEFEGHFQPRYRVCCPRSNDCNPMEIISGGRATLCEELRSFPCQFENAKFHDLTNFTKREDPETASDHLRGPIPFERGNLPPYSTETKW